jgi:hypothetical protein
VLASTANTDHAAAAVIRRLNLADERQFKANMLFANPKGLFQPR